MKLIWFRNDLRLHDNPALFNATQTQQGVIAVVALTPAQWQAHDDAPVRLAFWWDNVCRLSDELATLNIPLKVLALSDYASCGPALLSLAQQLQVDGLFFNREWPVNELQRDEEIIRLFQQHGIACDAQACGDLVIAPQQLRTGQGQPFKVFTPYARRWRQFLLDNFPVLIPPPIPQPILPVHVMEVLGELRPEVLPEILNANYRRELWPAGEAAAQQRLQRFLQHRERHYADKRDFPAQPATSTLSPWLACGVISPRQCLLALQQQYTDDSWLTGSWLNELVWREFYRHLLVDFPSLSYGKPFRPEVERRIQWQNDARLFDAWCKGETGFPLVDAAMHQLLQTGWMHNRLRMLTASFLTKLLQVDWRWGEQFFMQHLIDGDFASNRGGWQWSASVGADAAPYFRIFNPQRQLEQFDREAVFIQRWLPDEILQPAPIIDYSTTRKQVLERYKDAAP